MTQRPPRPTLFPYTTLFRSHRRREWISQDAGQNAKASRPGRKPSVIEGRSMKVEAEAGKNAGKFGWHHDPRPDVGIRSEEHTSELQSLTNLVCRLLLEKKNT